MSSLPSNVMLSPRARRELDRLPDAEATRLIDDIIRIAAKRFPGEIKPIATLPGRPLQADSGRFRILFRWRAGNAEIMVVFPRSDQGKVFKGMK